jgi:hypothetical protein
MLMRGFTVSPPGMAPFTKFEPKARSQRTGLDSVWLMTKALPGTAVLLGSRATRRVCASLAAKYKELFPRSWAVAGVKRSLHIGVGLECDYDGRRRRE